MLRSYFPEAQAHESDAVAMSGIPCSPGSEHEAREFLFERLHGTFTRNAGQRAGRMRGERSQQLFDTEVADGGTKEHRRLLARAIRLGVERIRRALHQLDLVGEVPREVARNSCASALSSRSM